MKSLALPVIMLTLAATAAPAATPWPPAPVVQAAAQFDNESDAPAPVPGKARVRKWLRSGMIRMVHVTGNAQPDWLVDSGQSDHGAAWCGTGGCYIQIWAPGTGGYRKVFDTQVRDIQFRHIPGQKRDWIDADFHGSLCGLTGVEPCPWGFEWRDDGTGQMGLNASLRFLKAPILRPGGVPQAIEPTSAAGTMPDTLRTFLAAQQAGCGQWNESFPAELVSRLPDVNGDGIDDWTYDGLSAYCSDDSPHADDAEPADNPHADDDPCVVVACRSIAWLSQREADGTIAWREARWDQDKLHAWRFAPGQPAQVIELSNHPGIAPGDDGECETFDLTTCVQTPVSLTP